MEVVLIVVLCAALWGIGFKVGIETGVNKPKTKECKRLDEISDRQLIALFMAVGSELESRGLARSTDKNPFEDLE